MYLNPIQLIKEKHSYLNFLNIISIFLIIILPLPKTDYETILL